MWVLMVSQMRRYRASNVLRAALGLGSVGLVVYFWSIRELVVVIALLGILAQAWLAAFQIRVTEHEVQIRSLFGGRRCFRIDEIEEISLQFKIEPWRGPLRLRFHLKSQPAGDELSINARVFPKEAIDELLEFGKRVADSDTGGLDQGVVVRFLRGG